MYTPPFRQLAAVVEKEMPMPNPATVGNQKQILANQKRILRNQDRIIANQQRILVNQKKILSKV
jgi:hypothetical protein